MWEQEAPLALLSRILYSTIMSNPLPEYIEVSWGTNSAIVVHVKEKVADNHALPLPGHLPAYKDYKVMLF